MELLVLNVKSFWAYLNNSGSGTFWGQLWILPLQGVTTMKRDTLCAVGVAASVGKIVRATVVGSCSMVLDCFWNVMAHAQKPDFVFRRNGRVHLNRRGRQFSRLLAAEVCALSGSNAGYTMFRGSVKGTGYPFHSPVSPSLPLPCVTVCHHISTWLYHCGELVFITNSKKIPQNFCYLTYLSYALNSL